MDLGGSVSNCGLLRWLVTTLCLETKARKLRSLVVGDLHSPLIEKTKARTSLATYSSNCFWSRDGGKIQGLVQTQSKVLVLKAPLVNYLKYKIKKFSDQCYFGLWRGNPKHINSKPGQPSNECIRQNQNCFESMNCHINFLGAEA